MELARFHFDALIPDGKGSFVRSDDPDASMSEKLAGDMSFLFDPRRRASFAALSCS
jgi:hypothetical protein